MKIYIEASLTTDLDKEARQVADAIIFNKFRALKSNYFTYDRKEKKIIKIEELNAQDANESQLGIKVKKLKEKDEFLILDKRTKGVPEYYSYFEKEDKDVRPSN